MASVAPPLPSDVVEVDLTDVAFGGDAIGRIDGQVVFAPFALPGERVRLALSRAKRDYATATVLDVLQASAMRIDPRCPHFGTCGGCQWQHATYGAQLEFKRRTVVEQLRRIGGLTDAEELVRPTIGMVEPWEYRNHVRFTLGRRYGDVGYTYRGTRRLLPVDYCHIAHPAINEVLRLVQRRCVGLRSSQIVVRYGSNTGDLLVNPRLPQVPELDSGQAAISEEILDRRFHVSAAAFFQVNTRRERRSIPDQLAVPWLAQRDGFFSMADLLALTVLDRLAPDPDDVVVDAYCGVGTFATLLAPYARRVVGIEESPAAVKDADRNAADLPNVRFITAKIERALAGIDESHVSGIVLDPARVGCTPAVITALLDLRPARMVYVSCDPATLARDLRCLREGGYQIASVEPLDMFAQTYHVETVTTLKRRE